MSLVLKQLFDFIKLLNSDSGTNQIAAGVACGMILGFSPVFSLQTVLVVVCIFFFRIQIGAALMAAVLFKVLASALDPVFDAVGSAVLETDALRPLFAALFNLPIIPLTRFNNSVVMGSGVVALLLAVPAYRATRFLVEKYRQEVFARFAGTKFWRLVQATSFYKWYLKYEQFHG